MAGRRRTEDDKPPNAMSFRPAARQPAATTTPASPGASTPSVWADLVGCIVLPLLLPASVLAIFRSTAGPPQVNLTDLALAFGAVAIACMVRSLTLHTEQWVAFFLSALIILCLQTGVALRADTVGMTDVLVAKVHDNISESGTYTPAPSPAPPQSAQQFDASLRDQQRRS